MIEAHTIAAGVEADWLTCPEGCWITALNLNAEERITLMEGLHVVEEFAPVMTDELERSHVDFDRDENQALIIVDCPCVEDKEDTVDDAVTQYDTRPLSILLFHNTGDLLTVSKEENDGVVQTVAARFAAKAAPEDRTMGSIVVSLLMEISKRYLVALQDIDRQFKVNEAALREEMNNAGLIRMLGLEKSLVYFSTSLKSLEGVVARLSTRPVVPFVGEERDELADVMTEVRQAIEMCEISQKLLSGSMEAFGQVINNNMNVTMRRLTIITLVLAVPTMVFSFYGMNTPLPLDASWLVPAGLAAVGAIIAAAIFFFSKRFK